jgi:hypothetical protein
MHVVTDCPCGQKHEVRQAISALYTHKDARMDSAWPVKTPSGRRYAVSRIYLSCHGINGADIEEAAARCGFQQIT